MKLEARHNSCTNSGVLSLHLYILDTFSSLSFFFPFHLINSFKWCHPSTVPSSFLIMLIRLRKQGRLILQLLPPVLFQYLPLSIKRLIQEVVVLGSWGDGSVSKVLGIQA